MESENQQKYDVSVPGISHYFHYIATGNWTVSACTKNKGIRTDG